MRAQTVVGCATKPNEVLESELSEVRLILQDYAGVSTGHSSEQLTGILNELLLSHGWSSCAELIASLRARPANCETLLQALLPAETSFFRPPEVFHAFQENVLPELKQRKKFGPSKPLRVWSAGCSTGEEAYSIGISICEAFRTDNDGWNAHIVAGDVRSDALTTAERGVYAAGSLAGLSSQIVSGYFSRLGEYFLVKPRLRNLVTFAHMNLIEPSFIGRFDCIFCLDVLPHLTNAGRTALLQRLHLALEPGGFVFLGNNEHFPAGNSVIQLTTAGCVYYQRPLAAAARSGR